MHPEVDSFFNKVKKWRLEMETLRRIILDCGLTEELKWGKPCYTFQGTNLVALAGLKEHCWLSFFKGALLQDVKGILEKPGENTQAGRVIKFTSVQDIVNKEAILKAYFHESIAAEKAGLKVESKEKTVLLIPEELLHELSRNPALKTAFYALTPGRQRAYNLYFSAAKQSTTRASRVNKYTQRILDGKGINDCTCGLSKRMPSCDGSHKYI